MKTRTAFAIALTCLVPLAACGTEDDLAGVDPVVREELARLGVEPTGPAAHRIAELPADLDAGPRWGVAAFVCEQGGYDLRAHAGRAITGTVFEIAGTCDGYGPAVVTVWTVEETVACVYLTVEDMAAGVPGLFDISECELRGAR